MRKDKRKVRLKEKVIKWFKGVYSTYQLYNDIYLHSENYVEEKVK